jgi:hypothetical protein
MTFHLHGKKTDHVARFGGALLSWRRDFRRGQDIVPLFCLKTHPKNGGVSNKLVYVQRGNEGMKRPAVF